MVFVKSCVHVHKITKDKHANVNRLNVGHHFGTIDIHVFHGMNAINQNKMRQDSEVNLDKIKLFNYKSTHSFVKRQNLVFIYTLISTHGTTGIGKLLLLRELLIGHC